MVDNGNHRWEDRTKENLHYFFRRQKDRWAEFRGIPIIKDWPSNHSVSEEPSNTLIIAAVNDGHDVDKLVHAMMYAHWVDDANLSNLDDLAKITNSVGLNADKLIEASSSKDVLDTYNENTEEAVAMSVFGSPTYMIDGDMFYGQDSLDLVEYALNKPFRKTISK
jgi:2-hydroxychromene-2-carboxylate isomerase